MAPVRWKNSRVNDFDFVMRANLQPRPCPCQAQTAFWVYSPENFSVTKWLRNDLIFARGTKLRPILRSRRAKRDTGTVPQTPFVNKFPRVFCPY